MGLGWAFGGLVRRPTPQNKRSRWRAIGEREPLLIDPISAGLPKQFRSVDQETIHAAPAVPIDSPYTITQ